MTGTDAEETGPWQGDVLVQLREWDRGWADACLRMSTDPWRDGVLSRKLVELISLGLNAACTNLNADGTRRHIRRALAAGATRDEVLLVVKCATVMALHSCSLGAPILLEEAKAVGVIREPAPPADTPACDRMKAVGQWNSAWDPFLDLDPDWTEAFITTAVGIYASATVGPKELELLSVAFDASFTHMYAPGTRRHIRAALAAGATMAEVMAVLKLCVAQGVQACNLAIPLLAEEVAALGADDGGRPG